jgi:FKBP-type peptidyl-prolyl cis-trans isomerase
MKPTLALFCALLLPALACAPGGAVPGESAAGAQDKPQSVLDRASYGIGYNIGRNLTDQGIEANLDQLLDGVTAGVKGTTPSLSEAEMQTAMNELQQQVEAKQREQQEDSSAMNEQAGEAFLTENGQRDEVTTTASGLQYEVLVEGLGPKPSATDTVRVHYHGTTIDGAVFDSSVERGEPAEFPLNGVISGWTEGLQLMGVGSKWKLFLPPGLAYGDRGAGPKIGPGSTLVFEVELLSIE